MIPTADTAYWRRRISSNRQLQSNFALLGNEAGVLDVRGRTGYVYLRELTGVNDSGAPTFSPASVALVEFGATFPHYAGAPVRFSWNDRNERVLVSGDTQGAVELGINPNTYNPGNGHTRQVSTFANVSYLRSYAVATPGKASTEIAVKQFVYRDRFGVLKVFNPTPADRIDAADHDPAAGLHRLILLYLNTSTNTIGVVEGTAKSQALTFNYSTDVAEVVNAMPENGIETGVWKVKSGLTTITAADQFVDLRQWISTPDKIHLDTTAPTVNDDTTAGYDIGHRWLDTTNDRYYICLDNTTSAAIWRVAAGGSPVTTKTANYTATAFDEVILVDASSNAVTVTLPTAAGIAGVKYTIKRLDGSANNVTIDADGSETIDGSLNKLIAFQYTSVTVISDGSNWHII